jgi:hypothetical protein
MTASTAIWKRAAFLRTGHLSFGLVYWLVFMLGLGWMIYVASQSPDANFQDEVGHVLMSKYAWRYPAYMLDVWGRPFNTIVYMLPALGGLVPARWFSVILACLTVYFTTRIAQKLEVKALEFIPLCLWFQPWFADFSYTANTMIPFSLLLILGIFLWLEGKIGAASLLFGLLPLTRHEGIALTGTWIIYMLVARRNWKAPLISLFPLALYNVVYFATYGRIASSNFFNVQPTTFYGSGDWFYYLPYILLGVCPAILILCLFSIAPIWRSPQKRLIFVPYLVYLLIHIVIYRFGLFASGGYGFFLMPLAPAFALSAAIGADVLIAQRPPNPHKRFRFRLVMGAIIVTIVAAGLFLTPIHPLSKETSALLQASNWLKDNGDADAPVIATHVWFFYFHGLEIPPDRTWIWAPSLDTIERGTIVVWDDHYSERTSLKYDTLISQSEAWEKLADFSDGAVVIFRRI